MKAKAWLQIGVSSQLAFTARPTFGSINRRPKMRAGGKLEYSFGDGRYPLNRKSWEVFINSFTDPNIFILYIYIYMCVCVCVSFTSVVAGSFLDIPDVNCKLPPPPLVSSR